MSVDVPRLLGALRAMDGTPWRAGGRSHAGVDCIGLLIVALRDIGVDIRRDIAGYTWRLGAHVLERELQDSGLLVRAHLPLQAGDVCALRVYDLPRHVCVMMDADTMIHATAHVGVRIVPMSALWRDRVASVWRWL